MWNSVEPNPRISATFWLWGGVTLRRKKIFRIRKVQKCVPRSKEFKNSIFTGLVCGGKFLKNIFWNFGRSQPTRFFLVFFQFFIFLPAKNLLKMAGIDSSCCGVHENDFKIDVKYFHGLDIIICMHFSDSI